MEWEKRRGRGEREGGERGGRVEENKEEGKGYMVGVDYYLISLLLGGAGIQLASLE